MQAKIEFYFGVELDKNKKPLDAAQAAIGLQAVERLAIQLYGGVTVQDATGAWQGETHLYREKSVILTVFSGNPYTNDDAKLAQAIKDYLGQEGVLVVHSACRGRIM